MEFKVIKDQDEWNRTIKEFRYDFFHTWDYHKVNCEQFDTPILFVVKVDSVSFAIPFLEKTIASSNNKDLISVYGYPGPLSNSKSQEANELCMAYLVTFWKKQGYVSFFSRSNPFCAPKISSFCRSAGEVVCVDLERSEDDILSSMRKDHRRDIRKLLKSSIQLEVIDSPSSIDFSEFMSIYNETMDNLKASSAYYFRLDFYRTLFSSDLYKTTLIFATFDGVRIAAGLFIRTGDVGHYYLSGTRIDFYKKYPMKLILWQAIISLKREGCLTFNLGGGLGGHRDSLFDFKHGFSKQTVRFDLIFGKLDALRYEELSFENAESLGLCDDMMDKISYFPFYRYRES